MVNTITEERLKGKRQFFHNLLVKLGEVQYKDMIIETRFGVESSKELTEEQLNILITDTEKRLNPQQKVAQKISNDFDQDKIIRQFRNKCLIVLNERGISATPKDWSKINIELTAARYQWIVSEDEKQKGIVNKRGLMAFKTKEQLQKLFYQLCQIRDNEKKQAKNITRLATNN